MKKIFNFIILFVMCLSFTSCITTAEAQTDGVYVSYDGVDFDVVITYGTPTYTADGLLMYYFYRGLYYYPYYQGNRWYFRHYSSPLRYYRPIHRDFYHHRQPIVRHHNDVRPRINNRPNIDNRKPNTGVNRPQQPMRSSTRINSQPRVINRGGSSRPSNGGHFGSRH